MQDAGCKWEKICLYPVGARQSLGENPTVECSANKEFKFKEKT